MTETISFAQYARRRGISRMSVYRFAAAGRLGPVFRVNNVRRLSIPWLTAHGLLKPETAFDRATAAVTLTIITDRACDVFAKQPKKLAQFYALWRELWGLEAPLQYHVEAVKHHARRLKRDPR
jgi:hypothetical protein